MSKEDLLKNIAQNAYNIGFGVKKHFATYDMVDKLPGLLSFLSITVGIFALYIDSLGVKHISAILVIFGIIGVYISKYDDKKDEYCKIGQQQLDNFDRLKTMYFTVKNNTSLNFEQEISELNQIKSNFNNNTLPKQIILSDWFAHYKFFQQSSSDIDWIEKELELTFFKDKVPLSLKLTILGILIFLLYLF